MDIYKALEINKRIQRLILEKYNNDLPTSNYNADRNYYNLLDRDIERAELFLDKKKGKDN